MNQIKVILYTLFFILFVFLVNVFSQINRESEKAYPKVELNNTEIRELVSSTNGYEYKIYIKFPKHYNKNDKNYPVLYVIDAETNFGGVSYIVQRHKV